MTNLPLQLSPGLVLTESIFAEPGRWIEGQNVRFVRGKPQKIGGSAYYSNTNYTGTARSIIAWSDFSYNSLVMVGTECKLMVYDTEGDISDITPFEATGTLGTDPFSTGNGDNTVIVTDTSHGRVVGDVVVFSGATTVGGLDMNGTWEVATVEATDTYTFEHTSAATSDDDGGGSAVDFSYELSCGLTDAAVGGGYGIGGFGEDTFGTERTDTDYIQQPRIWALDQYGEDVIAMPLQGDLYYFDSSNATERATAVANAPSSNLWFYVTSSRHLLLLGAGGDPMVVQWPDQSDITDWTPATTNTAGSRRLQNGSRLVAGTVWSGESDLIWTDTAVYRWRYIGSSLVFDSELIAVGAGLAAPHAFVVADGIAYWRSRNNFHMYNGYVQEMPNVDNIRTWINDRVSMLQEYKTFCGHNLVFNEIWWWFVEEGNTEPSIWLSFDVQTNEWSKGTMDRAAFANQENSGANPLMTGTAADDFVYEHETGVNNADGTSIEAYLDMAPVTYGEGATALDVERFMPDFQRQEGPMRVTLTTYGRTRVESKLEESIYTLADTADHIDMRGAGRYIALSFYSDQVDGDFRFGRPTLEIEPAGERQ